MAPSRISRRMGVVLFALPVLTAAVACDPNESSSPKAKPLAEASSSTAAPAPPKPPAPPAAPIITVDEASCTVDGEVVQMGAADASGRASEQLDLTGYNRRSVGMKDRSPFEPHEPGSWREHRAK